MKRMYRSISCLCSLILFFFCVFADVNIVQSEAADIAPRFICADNGVYHKTETAKGNHDSSQGQSEEITIMFAGDIMCLSAQQHVGTAGDCCDFRYSFENVRGIFASADLAVANLETLVSASNPYTGVQKNAANGSPQCNAPGAILAAVRYAGIDALMTANNHCCDWGRAGIEETLDMLDMFGFMHTGTGRSGDVRFVLTDVKGIRIALISTTHIINQRGLISPDDVEAMVNQFERTKLSKDIDAAREAGAEFVAVYVHWGSENVEDIRDYQMSDAGFIAEAGADMIIGSHPHCLQTCDSIETEDGRTVPVMYSLGNFLSSMAKDINNDTVILKTVISRDKSGKIAIKDMSMIPCWVTLGSFVITPISDANAETSAVLRSSRERIEAVFPEMRVKKYFKE